MEPVKPPCAFIDCNSELVKGPLTLPRSRMYQVAGSLLLFMSVVIKESVERGGKSMGGIGTLLTQ